MEKWYTPLLKIKSKGQKTSKARALHELHQKRLEHQGQFFTPLKISEWIWEQINPVLDQVDDPGGKLDIADNSVGTGRLLYPANPEKHRLHICDTDVEALDAFHECAQKAGFIVNAHNTSMQNMRMENIHAAIINPPFTLHFEGPNLEKFPTNSFGKFGEKSAAISQTYALEQALSGADLVVAIVPLTEAQRIKSIPHQLQRLRVIAHLPQNAFKTEGANVKTCILFFDQLKKDEYTEIDLKDLSTPIGVKLTPPTHKKSRGDFINYDFKDEPSILTPVTGDNRVRVYRNGRHLQMKFHCGLTEARVMNAIMESKIPWQDRACEQFGEGRLPYNIQYTGQGKLMLDLYLSQKDPLGELEKLEKLISREKGQPSIDEQLRNYMIKRHKRLIRQKKGFARWVKVTALSQAYEDKSEVEVLDDYVMNPDIWGGPIALKGDKINLVKMDDAAVEVEFEGQTFKQSKDYFLKHCHAPEKVKGKKAEWKRIGTSMAERNPEIAHEARLNLEKLGIDKWTWDWQQHDIIECAMTPLGVIASWDMGLGKTRLSFGACLMDPCKHALICVPAHLVDQFMDEAHDLGIELNVIRKKKDVSNLKKINIISLPRLRTEFENGKSFGKHMRRWFGLVIIDEGHCLRHHTTQQSRAARDLSPRKRIILSGTPISNYPRDIWPVANWAIRGGHIAQPYDLYEFYPNPNGFLDARYMRRGIDVFREKYVTLEWSTNHFNEDMEQGAKREIPRIRNLESYRNYNQSFILRRTRNEPDVAPYIKFPEAEEITHDLEWDDKHLGHYIKVADEFKMWFTDAMKEAQKNSRNISMIATLARIGAVEAACNHPHDPVKNCPRFIGDPTSKERAIVDRAVEIAKNNRKAVIFTQSPKSAERLTQMIKDAGEHAAAIHGAVSQKDRTGIIKDQFRKGALPILVATFGVAQTGLNLPEASHVLLACRQWTATVEYQSIARVLRPEQKNKVIVERFHLKGSIDDYQGQMVEFKKDASDSGLDFADPSMEQQEFLHIDHILEDFVKNIIELRGIKRHALKSA